MNNKYLEELVEKAHRCGWIEKSTVDEKTSKFLYELVERARHYGWDGDYVEIVDFVAQCFMDKGRIPPNCLLDPYISWMTDEDNC